MIVLKDEPDLINMLIDHEGLKLTVYKDTKGIRTIGIGRNLEGNGLSPQECAFIGVKSADSLKSITKDQAVYLLQNDLNHITNQLEKYPWYTNQTKNRQHALIDLAMMGVGTLLKFTIFMQQMEKQEFKAAASNLRMTKWASDVGHKRSGQTTLMIEKDFTFEQASKIIH